MMALAVLTHVQTLLSLDTARMRSIVSDVLPDDLDWSLGLGGLLGGLFVDADGDGGAGGGAAVAGKKAGAKVDACRACEATHVFLAIRSEYSPGGARRRRECRETWLRWARGLPGVSRASRRPE